MIHKMLRPYIIKVSVLIYFPLAALVNAYNIKYCMLSLTKL